jgi:hypothetical protein
VKLDLNTACDDNIQAVLTAVRLSALDEGTEHVELAREQRGRGGEEELEDLAVVLGEALARSLKGTYLVAEVLRINLGSECLVAESAPK